MTSADTKKALTMKQCTPHSPLTDLWRCTPEQKNALKKLNITTIRDVLYYFPTRYGEVAEIGTLNTVKKGDHVTVFGTCTSIKTSKGYVSKMPMAEATIDDGTKTIKAVWFHQPYIAKMLPEGSLVKVIGKVAERRGIPYLSNPEYEILDHLPQTVGTSLFGTTENNFDHYAFPVYPETKGLSSKWIYHVLQRAFTLGIHEMIEDPIPHEIRERYNLPSLATAFIWIHSPKREKDALAARKRFAFEEVFFIQIKKQKQRAELIQEKAFTIHPSLDDIDGFIKRFSFTATEAQRKAITDIINDFKKNYPMGRLLEGDVGSGKTAVAATTAFAVVTSRPYGQNFGTLQVAYMAPTEILATQLFESFIGYFAYLPIRIALITGSGCRVFPSKINPKNWTDISRSQVLKWVASGEIAIVIGTQALIQKTVNFKHLAYVIVDEQHRFGVNQRQKLATKMSSLTKTKAPVPHLLSMTATPIPRTLALTLYGDLDISLLDTMPQGRKQPVTEIVAPGTEARERVYEKIRLELKTGRQAYVVCPRIDEPDPDKEKAVNAKSVKEEAKRLERDVFPEFRIDCMHSKMSPEKKENIMKQFQNHDIDILVSTSVVEVGVNVPNASIMIIEGAERFGLAQLHQLRGRVIRGTHQPFCYVFTESKSETSIERLRAFITAKNGFELAEYDLIQRGSGSLAHGKQWGVSDLAMEAIKNIKMVEAARKEAQTIVSSDPHLTQWPRIKEIIANQDDIHFE